LIESEVAVIVMTTCSCHALYVSIVAAISSLIIGCEAEGPGGVVHRLIILNTELGIASRGLALETHSIVIQISEVNIQARSIAIVTVTGMVPTAGLPRVATIRPRHIT
jgi:hypothetical protein